MSAVTDWPPTVTVAFAMPVVAPCSTTVTVTACSVRSRGVATPCSSTFTGTSTVWPPDATVTVPPVVISGTPGTVTEPSLSASWAVCVTLLPSFTVTVAPGETVKATLWVPAFASSILSGVARPPPFTVRVWPLIPLYPIAVAPRSL